ncbi:MAG TPA: circadian clock protein KaiC [Oligoflexus sp.]|uniref:circadian clock protein KaiC n=1 Tax=Oligoflexus sp. TaxID=1971216 RepID=UPI002D442770|nr:circadian clock protein KaiC [Oligoflexus sp.]HYX39556.1 circadian clock protein KaiC [Oligoflexus sp.]
MDGPASAKSISKVVEIVEKIQTGIAGLDLITYGGIPKGRTTLVAGSAGSAKSVLTAQFIGEGIRKCGETGVLVTFEESPDDIRQNMMGLGLDIAQWEAEGKWVFVDVSRRPDDQAVKTGQFDLSALLARIEHAINKIKASRVGLDSLGAVFSQIEDDRLVRSELFRIGWALKKLRVTSLMTAERIEEYGDISRFGVEEFVTDNVILLRNNLENEKRRRTIEVLKLRGTNHQKGEFPFTVLSGRGIVIIPLSAIELQQRSTDIRTSSGNIELDKMCGGGFFRDSIILISGATGTGKTLAVTEFLEGGAIAGERCLIFAFEESRDQLFRNAAGWGVNFETLEAQGLLKVICEYPESASLEDHLVRMREIIEEYRPGRVAVDSLSALERGASPRSFREFVISLTSYIKHEEITGLFTATTSALLGGSTITEAHVSTITDSIILLRYVEIFGQMRRGLTVLKMRGSMHDKDIREYSIDAAGMHIGRPFRDINGILSGQPQAVPYSENSKLKDAFMDHSADRI